MPNMINFGVYIWPKSMLSVTLGKNCCIIKSMSSIVKLLASISKLRSEDIERVTKRERVICRPECFKMMLNSERVKTCLFLRFKFLFFALTMRYVIAFTLMLKYAPNKYIPVSM